MTTPHTTDPLHLMRGMSVQHYSFTVRVREAIILEEQPGSAVRGALYQALSERFCSEPDAPITPDHQQRCPVCWLLALEDEGAVRGRDVPRPLTIEPPLPRVYQQGETLRFGLSLIGRAQDLFPYLARAVQRMGEIGFGRGRGRFRLEMIAEYNPLLDARRDLMHANLVQKPTLQITPPRIAESAADGRADRITLEFISPLRLVKDSKLVGEGQLTAQVFVQRLLERCQTLASYYAEGEDTPTQEEWRAAALALQAQAAALRVGYDDTEWEDYWSGSRRKAHATPIGGLLGTVRWEGDVTALRPWLLWGQSLHVGKDAVKGNGWYRVKA
jgi:hypothetical protein